MSTKEVTIIDLLSYYRAEIPSYLNPDGWTKMLCPFHADTRASAGVNEKDNCFACKACHVRGDVVNVVARFEELELLDGEPDRKAAYEWIQRTFDGSKPRVSRPANASRNRRGKRERTKSTWRNKLFG